MSTRPDSDLSRTDFLRAGATGAAGLGLGALALAGATTPAAAAEPRRG